MTTQIKLDEDFKVVAELDCQMSLEPGTNNALDKYKIIPSGSMNFKIEKLGINSLMDSSMVTKTLKEKLESKNITFVENDATISALHDSRHGGFTTKRKNIRRKKSRKKLKKAKFADHI